MFYILITITAVIVLASVLDMSYNKGIEDGKTLSKKFKEELKEEKE